MALQGNWILGLHSHSVIFLWETLGFLLRTSLSSWCGFYCVLGCRLAQSSGANLHPGSRCVFYMFSFMWCGFKQWISKNTPRTSQCEQQSVFPLKTMGHFRNFRHFMLQHMHQKIHWEHRITARLPHILQMIAGGPGKSWEGTLWSAYCQQTVLTSRDHPRWTTPLH